MEKKYPLNVKDYKLYEEVGEGVSATVYRALCVPLNELVAIKVLDLEKCNNDLDGIRREVQTMSLIDHPNLLRANCSFTTGHHLWVVMPYMAGGSCLHILKSAYPDGFEEPVIATLLREVLKGLVYLHSLGHIHRDVKAGNILIDTNGTVKLADFGVTACLFDTGDRQRSRNTFVGTPCWMAPEVMQQVHGYDFKADIWSFGITALELAHGHAPFSKYPPMKVLLMTLQNAPPGLDYERDKRFSKSFKEIVAACLVKDSKKRPTAEKLLKHHFFKSARSSEYLARTILDGLPPLGDRFRVVKEKEADFLVQNRSLYEDKDHLSQQEYIRGISAWNFDLKDLKNQAALIPDVDVVSSVENPSLSGKPRDKHNDAGSPAEEMSPGRHVSSSDHMQDERNNMPDVDDSLAVFPLKPLQALKDCFDVCEDGMDAGSPRLKNVLSNSEFPSQLQGSETAVVHGEIPDNGGNEGQSSYLPCNVTPSHKKLQGSGITEDPKINHKGDIREHLLQKYPADRNHSGPMQYRTKKDMFSAGSGVGVDTCDGEAVQTKGRFRVTSADTNPKVPINSLPGSSTSGLPAAPILNCIQCMFQQNTFQREEIIKLMKYVEHSSGAKVLLGGSCNGHDVQASTRERELQSQVIHLQRCVENITDELQRQKLKNLQMEKKLIALIKRHENEINSMAALS